MSVLGTVLRTVLFASTILLPHVEAMNLENITIDKELDLLGAGSTQTILEAAAGIAIDGWVGIDTTRDEWMSKILNERASHTPVLALLGNLHTLKKVDWNQAMTKGQLYVAGILESQGSNVKTYPQMWIDRACNNRNQFIAADAPEAPGLLNSKLITLLNAFDSEVATDTIDGIILWEC